MGLGEDVDKWYEVGIDDNDDDSILIDYLFDELYWKTKDGDKILVSEMQDSHILNCMRIPKYPNKYNWDRIFRFELKKRNVKY